MKNLGRELRKIATGITVAETLRLKNWLTKEEFKETLDSELDNLYQLSKEVESEETNNN